MKIRLNKYLSECGFASRRKSEDFIKDGRVSVNGKVISDLATFVEPDKDEIKLDGEKVNRENKIYFILNKPKGFITTTKDEKNRNTVLDLIKTNKKVFPVGRLDYNTTGVLILTNDGDFANSLTHPRNKYPREYRAVLDKDLSLTDKNKFLSGIYLDNRKSRFIEINYPKKNKLNIVTVICHEGRNHFVKKMFSQLGYFVKSLERTSFAGIKSDNLKPGEYKKLSKKEVEGIITKR